METRSTVGTYRVTKLVEAYDAESGNFPGPGRTPDQIVEVSTFYEKDGTEITDPYRIEAIIAQQEKEAQNDGT